MRVLTVLSVLVALTVVSLGTKLLYRKMEKRILTVLHAEYILLLPAKIVWLQDVW